MQMQQVQAEPDEGLMGLLRRVPGQVQAEEVGIPTTLNVPWDPAQEA